MNNEQNHNHNNVNSHGQTCNCCCCGHGSMGMGRYVVVRWILGILILAFVFIFGVKIGMIRSSLGYGNYNGYYGHPHMMMQGQGYDNNYGY